MSILDALRLQRSEQNSVRDLAMLPQAQIVQLAQAGQIPADIVPIIISEKARMAQQAAQMQAAQQQPQPTVLEQAMAQNAQAETPMTGVAGIPTQMFQQQNFQTGGIVAFDDGGSVTTGVNKVRNPMTDQEEQEAFIRAVQELDNAKLIAALSKREGQPTAAQLLAQRAMGDGEVSLGAMGTPTRLQALMAAYQRDLAGGKAGLNLAVPVQNPRAAQLGFSYARRFAGGGLNDPFFEKTEETPEYTSPGPSVGSVDAYIAEAAARRAEARKPTEAMLALERSLVDPNRLASARREARDLALLQAGLGIMGGASRYGLQNIGRGAAPAAEAYGRQLSDIEKLQREGIAQRAALDLRKQEQAIADITAGEQQAAAARREALEEKKLTAREASDIRRAETAENVAEIRARATIGAVLNRPESPRAQFVSDYLAGRRAAGDTRADATIRLEAQNQFNALEARTGLQEDTLRNQILSDIDREIAAQRKEPTTQQRKAEREFVAAGSGSADDFWAGIRERRINERYAELAKRGANISGAVAPATRPASAPAAPPPKPDIKQVQGAPAGSTIGRFVPGKGWEVVKDGKVEGYVGE